MPTIDTARVARSCFDVWTNRKEPDALLIVRDGQPALSEVVVEGEAKPSWR